MPEKTFILTLHCLPFLLTEFTGVTVQHNRPHASLITKIIIIIVVIKIIIVLIIITIIPEVHNVDPKIQGRQSRLHRTFWLK